MRGVFPNGNRGLFKKGDPGFWTGKKRGPQSAQWIANRLKTIRKGANHPRFKHGLSRTREYKAFIENQRIARKRTQLGEFTLAQWEFIKEICGYTCLSCGRVEPDVQLTIDHIVPLSKGGAHDFGNIQPLCRPCNERKQARTVDLLLDFLPNRI